MGSVKAVLGVSALLGSALVLGACGPSLGDDFDTGTAVQMVVNEDPDFVMVYNNNIENLETPTEHICPGRWTDLFAYVKTQAISPDIFLFQQISDQTQLNALINHMNSTLAGSFDGVIAQANPSFYDSPCGGPKSHQTNAVVWRVGRFDKIGAKHDWRSYSRIHGGCVRDIDSRTHNVMVKLHDKFANKDLSVASIHWSIRNGGNQADPACALKNAREVDEKLNMASFGGALRIWGGDANEQDLNHAGNSSSGYRPWYAATNGSLGGGLNYRDAIYDMCQGAKSIKGCLVDNWSVGSGPNRIDFVFSQKGNGAMNDTSHQHVVKWDEGQASGSGGSLRYSDHRAIKARVYY